MAAGKMHIRAFTPCRVVSLQQNTRLNRSQCATPTLENIKESFPIFPLLVLHFLWLVFPPQQFPASHTLLQTSWYVCLTLVRKSNGEKRVQNDRNCVRNIMQSWKHTRGDKQEHAHPAKNKTQSRLSTGRTNSKTNTLSQWTYIFKTSLIVRL